MMEKPPHQGFTLLELLIAVAIMSIIAVLSWQALDTLVRTQQQVKTSITKQKQMHRFYTQLRFDCQNLVKQKNVWPTYTLNIPKGFVLWRKLDGQPSWQGIIYKVIDNKLWRISSAPIQSFASFDQIQQQIIELVNNHSTSNQSSNYGTGGLKPSSKVLFIENIENITLEAWDSNTKQWINAPSLENISELKPEDNKSSFLLPQGIRVKFSLQENNDTKDTLNQDTAYYRSCLTGI